MIPQAGHFERGVLAMELLMPEGNHELFLGYE